MLWDLAWHSVCYHFDWSSKLNPKGTKVSDDFNKKIQMNKSSKCYSMMTVQRFEQQTDEITVIAPFHTVIINQNSDCFNFYTPVFRRDVLWYGDVRPSVRPSGSPSVPPSVRHSFPHFSPTCFDILIWNFVYHFILMHVRSSSNAIHFRHFLQELCSFLTSNSYQYAVFRTFLLHALTYWAQILYCFNVPQSEFECRHFASIFVGVMPLCELRILKIHSFPHFSLTFFDILS